MINTSPPQECWKCKQMKPPQSAINIACDAGASPSVMKPLCADCTPKFVDSKTADDLRTSLAAAEAEIERLKGEAAFAARSLDNATRISGEKGKEIATLRKLLRDLVDKAWDVSADYYPRDWFELLESLKEHRKP